MANYGQPIPTEIPHEGDGKITSRKKWTIQEVEAMSAQDYSRNLRNPDFVAAIDNLYKPDEKPTEAPSNTTQ